MPILKSIAIHDNVKATLRYILNPDKTEGQYLCNSRNCFANAEDAYLNMKYIYERFSSHRFNEPLAEVGKNRVKAIHYIQSFKPDPNLTPELVHRMGRSFCRMAFGDNVQMVIATHVDKGHLHNHILINTYGVDGHKYNDNYTTRRELRKISDGVCLVFGVPVTEAKRKSGMSYCEWKHYKQGTSFKEQIRREIDTLVLCCDNYDHLIDLLEKRGYEMRSGYNTAIRAPGQKYFTNLRTLGEEYTIDAIRSRIEYRDDLGNASREDAYSKGKELTICYADLITRLSKLIVDGKKPVKKVDERYPYLPHNDRDVQQLGAQLALIERLRIYSVCEAEAKIRRVKEEYDKLVAELNEYRQKNCEIPELWAQYQILRELEDKPDKTVAEQSKLELARQMHSRDSITYLQNRRLLEAKKWDYDRYVAGLLSDIDKKSYLIKALQEIADTFRESRERSRPDYVLRLIERNLAEAKQKAEPEKTVPKQDESTAKPPEQNKSRGMKRR